MSNKVPGFTVIHWSQHWRRMPDGEFYRDAVAIRDTDGAVREISVPPPFDGSAR